MAALLTNIGLLFTQTITWIGEVLTMVVAEPILLIFVGLGLVASVIGVAVRLIKR